ncbi:MAG TPA: hypothetical protein VFV08_00990, partial [Puia sp.]|nr:hypothetical protein [Puia sp.]
MASIVTIYKDIFDGYLLIRQENADNDQGKGGEIIYQSDDLSMDHNVSFDSVARSKDELGLPAFIDTKIEGNDYKMFLHPFYIGNYRLIVAGVVNQSKYNSVIKKIPFTLISAAAILVLLLLIHLPILRIYLLGPGERIRDIDIRLIIGSYFVAAFVGFFLFSQAFLNNQADVQNEKSLNTLSTQISTQLCQEINLMVQQLKIFDHKYECLQFCDSAFLKAVDTNVYTAEEVRGLDSIFQPTQYIYPESVFWINKKADWVGRWAFKKSYRNGKFLNVADREYFRDFMDQKAIFLPGKISDPFTIQPTLSKRDGEFVVTVAIRSQLNTDEKDSSQPFIVGLSSQMYSISHVVLPPGFSFTIVNQKG